MKYRLVMEWSRRPLEHLYQSTAGYGLAVVTTALAALLRWLFPWALSPAPYLGFYPAVVVSAAMGGVGPGLFATFAALVLVNFVFGRFDISDTGSMARQFIWVAASLGVSILAGMQRAARMREHRQAEELRRWNDELETRVRERTAEIEEANRQLIEANEKLAELDHAKTAFFSNVSHEFRTPLTLMMGTLKNILGMSEEEVPRDIRSSVAIAHRNALRLLKLVNTLLDFSRIEAGRLKASLQPIDLARFTTDLVSHFHSACDSAGLELVVNCQGLSGPVYVDRDMYEKIVLNLVSNAFKFTFEGRIGVRLREVDGFAELAVSDTGIGIPRHELPRLFERFYRVEGARGRSYEGSGIGLALLNDLVRLHQGSIRVESEEGIGSTFIVRLPLGTDHVREMQPADAGLERPTASAEVHEAYLEEALLWLTDKDGPYGAEAPANRVGEPLGSVIVVDDNADMRSYIRGLLGAAGYGVETASDGESALGVCEKGVPDLILTDVMMPGMDGFALLKELRGREHTALVPVIMLSARAGEEARVEGLTAGADDYLVKPFGARELVARVEGAIKLSRFRREAAERERQVLTEANAALEKSNQALRDFTSIASHDLQEPLRKVSTFGGMLRKKYNDSLGEQGTGYLDRVLAANRRMQSLLDDLLAYSRLTTKAEPLVEVELAQIVREVLSDLEVRIESTGGEVRVGELPLINADPSQMRQLFQNLVGNALKFHKDGVSPLVTISGSSSENGNIEIEVTDNGIGFEEEYLEKIFAPFQRLHAKGGKFEGTGMGLAICKKIVERHGGTIGARSEPGTGSKFIVRLPAKQTGLEAAIVG